MRTKLTLLGFAMVCLLGAAGPKAWADTQLDVQAGWGGHVVGGRWIPIYITASDRSPRNVVLRIEWPTGGSYSMQIRQFLTIDRNPRTFSLLVPARGWAYQEATFTLADADTGKTLAEYPKDVSAGATFASLLSNESGTLIGVTGRATDLTNLESAISGMKAGYLEPRLVPQTAMGFDALDLLVLNEPALVQSSFGPAALTDAQQRAIVDWVTAGGNLILWPGDNGFPSSGPLVDVLPAKLGQRENVHLSDDDLKTMGLPSRYRELAAYPLEPKKGSRNIPMLNRGQLHACARQVGLGQIVLAPVNVSDMPVENVTQTLAMWRPLLSGMISLPAVEPQQSAGANAANSLAPNYYKMVRQEAQDEDNASMQIADFLGDVKGAGQIGFSYVAGILIGMMLVVGPLDWIVLKKIGRQPWTWVTTTGWVSLVSLIALYAGHVFKSGESYFRTLQAVDQVGDVTIATTDYVALYSPRTRSYDIAAPSDGWWQPAGVTSYGRTGMLIDMDFHQTDEGNVPEPMVVNVWSLRFLRGDTIGTGPPMIQADLHSSAGSGKQVAGKLTNLTDRPLRDIHVLTQGGWWKGCIYRGSRSTESPAAELTEIPPHSTVSIEAAPEPAPAANESPAYRRDWANAPLASDVWQLAPRLNGRRRKLIQASVDTGFYACVYAQSVNPPPAATLQGPKDHEEHWQYIRALVELH